MNFIDAVKSCFSKYFTFSGRARRSEYWFFFLFNFLVGLVLGILDMGLAAAIGVLGGVGILGAIYNLAVFFPTLAVTIRRLHDTGRSGWWVGGFYIAIFAIAILFGVFAMGGSTDISGIVMALGLIILLIWGVTLFVFMVLDSKPGDNQYGPNPKTGGQVNAFD